MYNLILKNFVCCVLQVVQCSIHSLPSPNSDLHLHTARHFDDEDASDRDTDELSLSLSSQSQCLADNFHYPHHCKVPDCTFMVAWRDKDGEAIIFNLTAKVTKSTMVWAAIGFSEDTKMVNTVYVYLASFPLAFNVRCLSLTELNKARALTLAVLIQIQYYTFALADVALVNTAMCVK